MLDSGTLVLLSADEAAGTPPRLVLRRLAAGADAFGAPQSIEARFTNAAFASGRLLRTSRGTWIYPFTRRAGGADGGAELACLRSTDAGATWSESAFRTANSFADPSVVESHPGTLLLVARARSGLVRCNSKDDGANWSALQPIPLPADSLPPVLAAFAEGAALAWTDAPPDTSWSVPGPRAVRLALSSDDGASWRALHPLAWAAGPVPWVPSLEGNRGRLVALLRREQRGSSTLACIEYPLEELRKPADPKPSAQNPYAAQPVQAARALELWCEQTLERPGTSIRLFIEGYFMRSLVAGHEVLHGAPSVTGVAAHLPPGARLLDTQAGLTRAVTFADWMLAGQDSAGYWPLGYKAIYVADMAAVTGLLAALVPHVDGAHARRYEAAAARFAAALQRDGMVLPTGAVGIGWPETRTLAESLAVRDPYLISTGLAGIELPAWLYARTHNDRYRQQALASIDYTLSKLAPDGSYPTLRIGPLSEGAYVAAAYVEEGWIAADLFLKDEAVLGTLRNGLRKHVGWLVRTQNPDGTWGTRGADGEWARTPPIVNFLIWYDRRCEKREDVREAVRRASVTLADPDAWRDLGLGRNGKNQEVMRALAGRALAALAKGDFVF